MLHSNNLFLYLFVKPCALLLQTILLITIGNANAYAQSVIPDFYHEPGIYPNRDYLRHSMGESIDPFTGTLKLVHTDAVIPGNGELDIRVQRIYSNPQGSGPGTSVPLPRSVYGVGWTMHFGRIVRATREICSDTATLLTSNNPTLELPDGTSRLLYNANGTNYQQGTSLTWVSADFWRASCDGTGNVNLYSPDGRRYFFNTISGYKNETEGTSSRHSYYAAQVFDRHGNSLTFNYDSAEPTFGKINSISASDGRSLSFSYSGSGFSLRLSSISWSTGTNTYTVSYGYRTVPSWANRWYLETVSLPHSLSWGYQYNDTITSTATGGCGTVSSTEAGSNALRQLTYPQGGTITYGYVFRNICAAGVNYNWVRSIVSKTRANKNWSFAYSESTSYDETTVTTPEHIERYRHYGVSAARSAGNGNLWRIGLLLRKDIGGVQVEDFAWQSVRISNENFSRRDVSGFVDNNGFAPVLQQHTITRDGGTYTKTFSGWSSLGNPTSVVESGPAGSRTHTITYCAANSGEFEQNRTITNVGAVTKTPDSACRFTQENKFGTVTNYQFNTAGEVSRKTDAKGDYVVYNDYYRGIAREETAYNTMAAQMARVNRTVSDVGNVLTETNPATGLTTRYSWDGLNRITAIDHPINADVSIAYSSTQRTLTRGALTDQFNYDGYGLPLSRTVGGISFSYAHDAYERKTFESYPGSSNGTTTAYDAINRKRRDTHSDGTSYRSDYSAAGATFTNERSFVETQAHRIYGDPDNRQVMSRSFSSLTGSNVSYTRDGLDRIRSVTQSGLTRRFEYNATNCLYEEFHPEIGVIAYDPDAVCNKRKRQVGNNAAIQYTYDGLNRLKTISHPAIAGISAPNTTFDYFADGKLQRAAATNGITREYAYDGNRNMILDKLIVDGYTFNTYYAYDLNDALSTITYPATNAVVSYGPDALGRPTQVSVNGLGVLQTIASSVVHHASGQPASWTYGNGIAASTGVNARMWASFVQHTGVFRQDYGYDGRGNVTAITDSSSAYSLSAINYDQLDRLTNIGTTAGCQFCYDGRGNITSRSWGVNSPITYNYDTAANRLGSLSGGAAASYAYDVWGNTTTDGTFRYDYDDASTLRRVVQAGNNTLIATYTYDGKGQRIKKERPGSLPVYTVHGPAGQVLLEYDAQRQVATEYFYLGTRQLGRRATLQSSQGAVVLQPPASAFVAGSTNALIRITLPVDATGTVTFYSGSTVLGTGTIVNGVATFNGGSLAPGCYNVTATYSGDANYQGSSTTATRICVVPNIMPILQLLLLDD
jgi:YD repeat-containing protein